MSSGDKPAAFEVRNTPCATCIYRKNMPVDLIQLENQVRGAEGEFVGYRVCHHTYSMCCRGFWNAHQDEFQEGREVTRGAPVLFVDEDQAPSFTPQRFASGELSFASSTLNYGPQIKHHQSGGTKTYGKAWVTRAKRIFRAWAMTH